MGWSAAARVLSSWRFTVGPPRSIANMNWYAVRSAPTQPSSSAGRHLRQRRLYPSAAVPPSRSPQPSWLPDLSSCVKSGHGVCAIGPQKDRIESKRRASGRLGFTPSRIERDTGVGNQRGREEEGACKARELGRTHV